MVLVLGAGVLSLYRNNRVPFLANKTAGEVKKSPSPGYDIDVRPHIDYAKEVLKSTYLPPSPPIVRLFAIYDNISTSWYKTNTWTRDGKSVSLEGWQTIKGDKYDKSFLPLEYDVFVKDDIPPNLSASEKFNLLDKYFLNQVQLSSISTKEIPVSQQKIQDIFSDKNSGDAPIRETVVGDSKILEGTWKNSTGQLESRAVWTIASTKDSETVYFIACRVFPLSKLYKNSSCVGNY